MLKKWSERLRKHFMGLHVATLAHLDDAFSELFELEASIVEGQSLQQKVKKRGTKWKSKKKS